jgi:hypothetical protein
MLPSTASPRRRSASESAERVPDRPSPDDADHRRTRARGHRGRGRRVDERRRSWTICHLLIGDEPAPAVAEQNASFSDSAWMIALSSRRLPTPLEHRPAMLASNAPGRKHWSWRRFVTNPPKGCVAFRIPSEEAIPADQLAEMERALSDRPDLLARLRAGEAAEALLGAPVAQGYSAAFHVSLRPLRPVRGSRCGLAGTEDCRRPRSSSK